MKFQEFLNKVKKPALIASGVLVSLALAYYASQEDEEDQQQQGQLTKEQQMQQMLQEQQKQQEQLRNSNLSPEEQQKEQQMLQTLQLKKVLQQEVKIEYNEQGMLTLQTIKLIQHRSVMLGLRKLISIHATITKQRQDHFDDLMIYFSLTSQLYDHYYNTLNSSLLTVVILLEIKDELFTQSKKYYEDKGELKPNYLRDLTWHFMAEELSQREMTQQEYMDYLEMQIKTIPEQLDVINKDEKAAKLDGKAKKLFLNGRVDDFTFFKTGFSDCDAIKALRKYIQVPEVSVLLSQRTETLDKCC